MRRVRCQAQLTVDAKGRLALPRPIRAALEELENSALVLHFNKGAIWLWTADRFADLIEARQADADPFDEEVAVFAHAVMSTSCDVEMDGQGRVRLPSGLRNYARIEREVVVHSIMDHIEIWDRGAWEQRFEESLHQWRQMKGMPRGER
jgi:MraZ protein